MIEPILDARALALWVDHTLDKRSASPIELTILAKPPAALMRRAKPALRISREDPALEGWSHRGKARTAQGVMVSVWQRDTGWTWTVGGKRPFGPSQPHHESLPLLLEAIGSTKYLGFAKRMSRSKP